MALFRRYCAVILAVFLCLPTGVFCAFAEETVPVTEPAATEATEITEPAQTTETTEATESTEESTLPEETEAATEPETVEAVTFFPAGGEVDASEGISVTLSCATEGAVISYAVSTDGVTYGEFQPYTEPIPLNPGFGTLFIKAKAEKERSLSTRQTVAYYTEMPNTGWDLYFGQLHSHSDASDGAATPAQLYEAAAGAGMDFFAVTDHANSLDNSDAATISQDATAVSTQWAAGKEAALAATNGHFVGIYGYEIAWPNTMVLGHISTFNTPGFQSWKHSGLDHFGTALPTYYATLATVPDSVSQFNHPGTFYGDFQLFGNYTPEADAQMHLLEVSSGVELEKSYEYYTRALDAGWHVAPTNSQNTHSHLVEGRGRTVVYAESLTEEHIYDALRHYRAYATEDNDLSVFYCLDDYFMGTLLEQRHVGETVTVTAKLSDPSDEAIGTVELIVDGGASIATETVETNSANIAMAVPSEYRYYYLRITQPDGDTAVTAPVWIDHTEQVGISSFVCDTELPIKNQPVSLSLSLFNDEQEDLVVENVDIAIGDKVVHSFTVGTVEPGQTKRCAFTLTHNALGHTRVTATVTATLGGLPRTYTANLTMTLRVPEMVTNILVDGSHGNVPAVTELRKLAEENQIRLTLATEPITTYQLSQATLVIIPAPKHAFEEEFIQKMTWYADCGGRVILCGQSDRFDGAVHSAAELNRLLEAMGSSLAFRDDTAVDPTNNGGSEDALYLSDCSGSWCDAVTAEQVYRQISGCTVTGGTGLVKGYGTTHSTDGDGDGGSGSGNTVLACEGRIFAAGSFFLSDGDLVGPENIWDAPYANRTIARAILGDTRQDLPLSSIGSARKGEPGEIYRIRGYVTAGTANAAVTFPETLYIQDDTGGIALMPFTQTGIAVGTPMDITGALENRGGNPVLNPITWEVLDAPHYRYEPLEGLWNAILVPESYGGRLLQVQGQAVQIIYNGETLSEILLKDKNGNQAIVYVEECIRSAATGENTLDKEIQVGRTVRAYGILHIREDGKTVLRVRNCDEVVDVPPINYVWKQAKDDNPRVGDSIGLYVAVFVLSGALLWKIRRRK